MLHCSTRLICAWDVEYTAAPQGFALCCHANGSTLAPPSFQSPLLAGTLQQALWKRELLGNNLSAKGCTSQRAERHKSRPN